MQPDRTAPWPAAEPRPAGRPREDTLGRALTVLSALAMLAALGMVFLYAPRERTMGDVQRIFYFHVAAAWVGFAAFAVTCGASAAYLARRDARHDRLARPVERSGPE